MDGGRIRFALSTNWCAKRFSDGAAIADLAGEMGFDALELGYNTSFEQVPGFKSRIDRMPVDSVHAFCPVPVSAPRGYPELHLLASEDEDERALAAAFLRKSIQFAAETGARAVVLHAGRVFLRSWLGNLGSDRLMPLWRNVRGTADAGIYSTLLEKAKRRRRKRGAARMDVFCRELEKLFPALESAHVRVALENLPSIEGFPDEDETLEIARRYPGAPVAAWFDIGHAEIRAAFRWTGSAAGEAARLAGCIAGCHIHDVKGLDGDHCAVGEGHVDFAALRVLASPRILHVFEPAPGVSRTALQSGLESLRRIWGGGPAPSAPVHG